ncbi:SDR family NAD(P)-dependent oxidoreductase [Corynebacterium pacaense]|uniref:SDR family NAD(P)-dependent oxidoreductase n=1 Tax=Corynebacterium pacaense TaxID=1816684 RepID=UPI0009BC5158|nr:SDR family NAD(P)-dependent oxidoreductase [Corynebacterium pacaense]
MSTILITGASSGIGAAAARLIAANTSDELILVGRNPERTSAIATELGAEHHIADFSQFDQVRALAASLSGRRIDVPANNAGGLFDGPRTTADGFELTWQVNYLAPFLLTHLLREQIGATVNTASVASVLFSHLDPDNPGEFHSSNRAYGTAKLANIMFARALTARGIPSVSFHPGVIATGFAADSAGAMNRLYHSPIARLFSRPDRGGANLAYFITGVPGITWRSGTYYGSNRRPALTRPLAYGRAVDTLFDSSLRQLGISNF